MESKGSPLKAVVFSLLVACVVVLVFVQLRSWHRQRTERSDAIHAALARINGRADVLRFLGSPITNDSGVVGSITHDETGWREARLTIPVHGPNGRAKLHIIGGSATGDWSFTTFEIFFEEEYKKLDLISGKVIDYSPGSYIDVHTASVVSPEYIEGQVPAPRSDGNYPCVSASVMGNSVSPQFAKCAIPTSHNGAIDRFEVDLRDGNFVLRETDLRINDVFDVPLTRCYRSNDWTHSNPIHAFGRNSNHPYDITPLGTRNPYTYQMLVLEDGEFLYFDRISKGTGYADAVYRHTETSTRFYNATQSWNGNGWTMKLTDGSEILFPESYNAKNIAQGAPTEQRDAEGNRLEFKRDSRRNLQEIRTPHGHWIRFSYDSLSRINLAENDAREWAEYEYNSDGMLENVTLSSGRQRHYEYQGHLMIKITNEAGVVLIRNWYDPGLVRRQEFGNGAVFSYNYDWPPKAYYPSKVIVTLPDQTHHELSVAEFVPEFVRNYKP